jgi:hypothetical protein
MKFRHPFIFTMLIASVGTLWGVAANTKNKPIRSDLMGKWQASYVKASSAGADIQYSIRTEELYTFRNDNTYSIKTTIDNVYYKNDIEDDECRHTTHIIKSGRFQLSGNIVTLYNNKQISSNSGGKKSICNKLDVPIDRKRTVNYVKSKYSRKWHINQSDADKNVACIYMGDLNNKYDYADEYCRIN